MRWAIPFVITATFMITGECFAQTTLPSVKQIMEITGGGAAAVEAHELQFARIKTVDDLDRMLASADAVEGPRAFAEKRPPVWRGQ